MTGAEVGPDGPAVSGPTSAQLVTVRDASELAAAFGSPIFEPMVWPADVVSVSYVLERFDSTGRTAYRIEGLRSGRPPVLVIGRQGTTGIRPGYAGWAQAPLTQFSAAFSREHDGTVDIALQQSDQAIHLLGYSSPEDAAAAANSLRFVTDGSD